MFHDVLGFFQTKSLIVFGKYDSPGGYYDRGSGRCCRKKGVLDDEDLNIFMIDQNWLVVSNTFYFHPYLGKMNPF